MKKPIILIVADYREGSETGYSRRDHYALGKNYVDMINHAGGAAIIVPYDYEMIDSYLNIADGLMIVGGYFDIDPRRYGELEIHPLVKFNKTREEFEDKIIVRALMKKTLPIFGICNGMQLINVMHGGCVVQHVPDQEGCIDHEQGNNPEFKDYHKPYHLVKIEKDSKIFAIGGKEEINVNSSHHQAARKVGSDIRVAARAIDGVIEAIEHKTHPFCIGVQWHPEYLASEIDSKLFSAFVSACLEYSSAKSHNW